MGAERKLLSTAEACQISGFGRQYIERLLRQGRLVEIKPAHDWLVYEDSLHAFLLNLANVAPLGHGRLLRQQFTSLRQKKPLLLNRKRSDQKEMKKLLRDNFMTSS